MAGEVVPPARRSRVGGAWTMALAWLVLFGSRAATPCRADPQEVDVRLDWLRPPARIEIEPLRPGARMRVCPPCRAEPLARTARLTADGGRLLLERGGRRGGAAPEAGAGGGISGGVAVEGGADGPARLRLPSTVGGRGRGGRVLGSRPRALVR